MNLRAEKEKLLAEIDDLTSNIAKCHVSPYPGSDEARDRYRASWRTKNARLGEILAAEGF